ncbi:hypothetical protein ACJ41O_004062 [Fusarium nematophilum]
MKLMIIGLVWLLAAAIAQDVVTFAPPADLEDGFHVIELDEGDGDFVRPNLQGHLRSFLDLFRKREKRDPAKKEGITNTSANDPLSEDPTPLPVSKKGCTQNTSALDPADHWSAKQKFHLFCENKNSVYRQQAFVGVKGTAQFWICGYGSVCDRAGCSVNEIIKAEGIFNQTCGDNRGAWIHMKKWKKSFGRGPKGEDIHCKRFK